MAECNQLTSLLRMWALQDDTSTLPEGREIYIIR